MIDFSEDDIYDLTIDGELVKEVTIDGIVSWIEGEFDVHSISAPSEVSEGESFTVSATVENVGDGRDTQTIDFNRGGDSSVTLVGEETSSESFSETLYSGGNTYTMTVSSDDDSDSTSVYVLEPAYFSVYSMNSPSEVNVDESFTVSAYVKNTGEDSDGQRISYNYGGSNYESLSGGSGTRTYFSDSFSSEGSRTLSISSDDNSTSSSIDVVIPIPDSEVYLHDDWGDNNLRNRSDSGTRTYNGVEGIYRPEWYTVSGMSDPSVSDETLTVKTEGGVYTDLNLDLNETITWEYDYDASRPSDYRDTLCVHMFAETNNYTFSNDERKQGFERSYVFNIHDGNSTSGRFLKIEDGGGYTNVIDAGDPPETGTITITREPNGTWEVFYNGVSEGSAKDTDYTNVNYTGICGNTQNPDHDVSEIKIC